MSVLKSVGEVYLIERGSFKGKEGEEVPRVTLYVPETHSTIAFYGEVNCAPFRKVADKDIGLAVPLKVTFDWRFSKNGFKPRIFAVD